MLTDTSLQMPEVMTEAQLAEKARMERHRQRLTQKDVAERVGRSTQAVSKAENYDPEDGMTRLRIEIVEELTGRELKGPLWELGDEPETA
jgi:transcriptional regulator with XRE-family HTH domain